MTAPARDSIVQFAQDTVQHGVLVGGTPTNADGAVTATLIDESAQAPVFTRTADHPGTGMYAITLSPDDTSVRGNYTLIWAYQVSGEAVSFPVYLVITGNEPAYDTLSADLKGIVESVWVRFADLFDSADGGPHLQAYFQSHWNRGRVAQLMGIAVGRLNTQAQPFSSYSITDPSAPFPTAKWGALLEQITVVEVIKHLRRSYVEQPEYQGSSISRLDRRDYMQRWGEVLADEEAQLKQQLDVFKISQMGLGRPAVLIQGGIYGRWAGSPGPWNAARPRVYWASYL